MKISKLLILMVSGILVLQSCKKDEVAFNNYLPEDDKTPPALLHPFASVASATRFVRFGDTIPGSSEISTGYWIWFSDPTTKVVSCTDGIVSNVEQQDNGDWRVSVKTKSNSIYSMIYENLKDLQVSVNDVVLMGTILGTAGQNSYAGFKVAQKGNRLVCPKVYASSGFDTAMITALNRSNVLLGTTFTDPCVVDTLQ